MPPYHTFLYRDSDEPFEFTPGSNIGVGKSTVSRSVSKFILINALASVAVEKKRERENPESDPRENHAKVSIIISLPFCPFNLGPYHRAAFDIFLFAFIRYSASRASNFGSLGLLLRTHTSRRIAREICNCGGTSSEQKKKEEKKKNRPRLILKCCGLSLCHR